MDGIAHGVSKYLYFHMTRFDDGFFKNKLTRAKGPFCFGASQLYGIGKIGLIMDQTHTSTATTRGSLNHKG